MKKVFLLLPAGLFIVLVKVLLRGAAAEEIVGLVLHGMAIRPADHGLAGGEPGGPRALSRIGG